MGTLFQNFGGFLVVKNLNKIGPIALLSVLLFNLSYGQSTVHPKEQAYRDSLMNSTYPYKLPILGDKVQKTGHELPLPNGIMFNFITQTAKLGVSNLEVGIGNSDKIDAGFVEFDEVENTAHIYNFRADAWILPFLNVYGFYAYAEANTDLSMSFPFDVDFVARPTINSFGGGAVVAYGFNDYFLIYNLNLSVSHTSTLDNSIPGMVNSLRIGRSFALPRPKHSMNFSFGFQHQKLGTISNGSIPISRAFSSVDQAKLDELKADIADAAQNWYDDLGPAQKLVVNQIVDELQDWLDGTTPGDAELTYSFDKKPVSPWSAQFGAQYNYGKRWWFRVEYGYGPGRSQLMTSVNYRFGF